MNLGSNGFPKNVEAISVDWLNEVLPGDAPVSSYTYKPVDDQGVTSLVFVLDIEFEHDEHDIPTQLLAKFATDHEVTREALRGGQGFRREVDFYRELGDKVGIAIPHCYALGYDDSDNSFMLLLEYLNNSSVRDLLVGNAQEVKECVEHLAALHAKWWRRSDELAFVERENQPALIEQRKQRLSIALENIKVDYQDKIGDVFVTLLELYLPNIELILNEAYKGPLTLCHGDFHRQQLLFPDNSQGKFCVIDWQTVTLDRGATDLARIIVTGLTVEDRRKYETQFVERYYELLREQGIHDYTLEQLWWHYRLGIVKLLLIHCSVFSGFDIAPLMAKWSDIGLDWLEVFFRWPSTAVEDHKLVDFLSEFVESLKA